MFCGNNIVPKVNYLLFGFRLDSVPRPSLRPKPKPLGSTAKTHWRTWLPSPSVHAVFFSGCHYYIVYMFSDLSCEFTVATEMFFMEVLSCSFWVRVSYTIVYRSIKLTQWRFSVSCWSPWEKPQFGVIDGSRVLHLKTALQIKEVNPPHQWALSYFPQQFCNVAHCSDWPCEWTWTIGWGRRSNVCRTPNVGIYLRLLTIYSDTASQWPAVMRTITPSWN